MRCEYCGTNASVLIEEDVVDGGNTLKVYQCENKKCSAYYDEYRDAKRNLIEHKSKWRKP